MSDTRKRILLIDDEEAMCRMIAAVMTDQGYAVTSFTRSPEAVTAFSSEHYDVVISDVKMPTMDGLEVLQRIKEIAPDIPVLMITAHATVDMSIQALRKGAYDMLTKPFEPEELLSRVRNALRQTQLLHENLELREELATRFGTIVGASPKLLAVLDTARKVATRDIPILITGESGTGKELVARAIHEHSDRRLRRFVAINCGAIPEALLENELFGHCKGAYTGADREHKGLLESADGGTLFLDEVGNLPLNVQKTLLRFLQEQEFYRVGDTRPTRVDVRVLSATNLDLQAAVQSQAFREDLYYRLNVVNVRLPPLRERRSDIPLLVGHFVRQQNERFGTAVRGCTPEAMERLCHFAWPGNIRQLSNVIQAAMAIENGDLIGLDVLMQLIELPANAYERSAGGNVASPLGELNAMDELDELDYPAALARFETAYLNRLLRKTGGNVEEVAHQAGMNIATIYRKMKKYGIR
ncbi:MAG: sigma-54-dependent Fis family transcriptional regulator [Gammaproteobacteria bacterium]|nr:sigma-54-dependent Fis family transcriptional regulator [Gammaproteobacteria bacterium]MCP5423495.1 sigma-54-dependent Fis family transcriptional regulator [Gammaproteobacteria bacterium]